MANTCAHCSRVNPAGAAYCYFDGSALGRADGAAPQNIGSQAFPTPFVFPSGKTCPNFDQLALACQQDWTAAVELLKGGILERFLGNLGRMDLAMAARSAAAFPDLSRGLDQLLDRLPTQALQPPKLRVEPTEVNLGTLKTRADQRFPLKLTNQGMRLLYGSVVSDCPWLALSEGQAGGQKLFQTSTETPLLVTVRGRALRAGKVQEGRLTIESNGGRVTVTVKAMVPARPFPEGVLAGATTPRQIAEKARDAPKDAARFFESGAVARWYAENGWTYPVQGPSASGLGAVQQFFEALGLAKPPRVEITQEAISLQGAPGESVRQLLQVRTPDKRPVFASATSDQGWLRIGKAILAGPVATLPLEVAQIPDQPGQVLQARVCVTANGGQRFVVPVSLTVGAPGAIRAVPIIAGPTRAPVDTAVEAGLPEHKARPILAAPGVPVRKRPRNGEAKGEPEGSSARKYLILAGLLLLLVVGIGGLLWVALSGGEGTKRVEVAIKDDQIEEKKLHKSGPPVFETKVVDEVEESTGPLVVPPKVEIKAEPEERTRAAEQAPVKVDIKDEPEEVEPVKGKPTGGPVDPTPRVTYNYGPNQRFGITAMKDQFGRPLNKRITYSFNGATSNTRLKIDGQDRDFGEPTGQWLSKGKKIADNPTRQSKNGSISILQVGTLKISQILEVVPSKQPVPVAGGVRKRLLDTVLIRYVLENNDNRPHALGIRAHVDTLIGNNDGVPFTVPGRGGLVDTFHDFRQPNEVPDFIQALEVPNLQNPGTVAHMTLKVGGGLEPPSRVSLTHWPTGNAPWEVPVMHMGTDSAVIIYWNERVLQPKQKREVGFAYGLGAVDASEAAGKLGITLGGSFEPGQVFTVTAYVVNPVPKQTLTLEVPAGLQVLDAPTVVVPKAQGKPPTSVVTWNTKVLQTGEHRIRVKSSTGAAQSKTITIVRPESPSGGRLVLDLQGPFEPGKVFTVNAKIIGGVQKQTLRLVLPKGLERAEGPESQPLPAAADQDGSYLVSWKVKVMEPGKFPVRVESNAGVARTATLTISQGDSSAGRFALAVTGDDSGKLFRVAATVPVPLPKQTLTLKLDPGMTLLSGQAVQTVPPAPTVEGSKLLWNVQVQQPGKYALRVESSHGLVLKRTITVARPDESAGKFVVDLTGEIAPGKEFTVIGKVTNPVKGQKLTLNLPKELQLTKGALSQDVPAFAEGGGTSLVNWTVRVLEKGTLRVRVESTTGYARTKTISITEKEDSRAIFGGN
ncbi:MAG TPA: hypothetical protein VEL76_02345 [Gemmataceae bacterium]|nr:hypothetical protein [Gemmataceae bacterium]